MTDTTRKTFGALRLPAVLAAALAVSPAIAQSVVIESGPAATESSTTKTTVKEKANGDTVVKEKTRTTDEMGDSTVRTEKRTVEPSASTTTTTTVR